MLFSRSAGVSGRAARTPPPSAPPPSPPRSPAPSRPPGPPSTPAAAQILLKPALRTLLPPLHLTEKEPDPCSGPQAPLHLAPVASGTGVSGHTRTVTAPAPASAVSPRFLRPACSCLRAFAPLLPPPGPIIPQVSSTTPSLLCSPALSPPPQQPPGLSLGGSSPSSNHETDPQSWDGTRALLPQR